MSDKTVKLQMGDDIILKFVDNTDDTWSLAVAQAAGESHIGNVGAEGDTILAPTPAVTAGAYIAGDCVGGMLTFANAARVSGSGGVIKNLIIWDDAGQDAEMELWLFRDTFTSPGDNAPWTLPQAEMRALVGIITTANGAWFESGTESQAVVECAQRFDCDATSLYGQLVNRGTPTFVATNDVDVAIGLLQD